jgi:nitrate reductase cytochrome c-type subunit
MTEPKKKQDFSVYKQFPIRLNINKCLDTERIAKIAEMQGRGISFVDFVRNALDKYEMGGKI